MPFYRWDDNTSAYWYFYGTRLYREDYVLKNKGKKKKNKDEKKCKKHGEAPEIEEKTERVWQVICFTEADWIHLTDKFKGATSRVEKDLYLSLSENFLPEIPRLFQEKERLRRKRYIYPITCIFFIVYAICKFMYIVINHFCESIMFIELHCGFILCITI